MTTFEPELEPDQEISLDVFRAGWERWVSKQSFWSFSSAYATVDHPAGYYYAGAESD